MADLASLLRSMDADGYFRRITRNPLAQFGVPTRRYIGAELLPEREVDENTYKETAIKYRTVIANAGTRYSPAQKKQGELIGEFLVDLAHSDIAREMTSRDYDTLLKIIGRGNDIEAMANIINFVDTTVVRALIELNEVWRWAAMVSASLTLTGDNSYTETVSYSNPSGHRFNASVVWSNDANDPFVDILAAADLLESKGYTVSRIITSRNVVSILAGNDKVKTRTGVATISPTGQITATAGRASLDAISIALGRDGLPPLEMYDLLYRTQVGTSRFLANNVMVFVATTGQSTTLDQGDTQRLVSDTLGYFAVGRPAGQDEPGRALWTQAYQNKSPRLEAEGWQTGLPVITEPEAIAVIGSIS